MTGPLTLELSIAQDSKAGSGHFTNEDRLVVQPAFGLYAVVDGVSGAPDGDKAASVGAEALIKRISQFAGDPESRLAGAVIAANNDVFEAGAGSVSCDRMCATMTAVLINRGRAVWAQVGDTKMYVMSAGTIKRVTPIHSPVGRMLAKGEITEDEARVHPQRNVVSRCLGSRLREIGDHNFVEIGSVPLKDEIALLISSDGLNLPDHTIRLLSERYASDPDRVVQQLIATAKHIGSTDDISTIWIGTPGYVRKAIEASKTTEPVNTPATATVLTMTDLIRDMKEPVAPPLPERDADIHLCVPAPVRERGGETNESVVAVAHERVFLATEASRFASAIIPPAHRGWVRGAMATAVLFVLIILGLTTVGMGKLEQGHMRAVEGCRLADLQKAIEQAKAGDTVLIRPGRFSGGEIVFKHGVRIVVGPDRPGTNACEQPPGATRASLHTMGGNGHASR